MSVDCGLVGDWQIRPIIWPAGPTAFMFGKSSDRRPRKSSQLNVCVTVLLSPVQTHGAMYMMVSLDMKCFPEYKTELEFVQGLIAEESVYCLPGTAFSYPGAIRIVLTNEQHHMAEACSRIAEFCNRHYKAFDLDHHRNGYNKKL
jgi:hypothetical protein